MGAAVWVHPHGLALWDFLLRELLFAQHEGVSEWQPLQGLQLLPWAVFFFGALILLFLAKRWRLTQTFMLVLVGASVLRNGRFFPLVVVFATLVGVHALAALWPRLQQGRDLVRRMGEPAAALVLSGLLALPFALSFVGSFVNKGLQLEILPGVVPPEATAFLAERRLGPNLAVNFQWGGYAIWHLHHDYKVSADGRNTTVYADDFIGRYVTTYYDGTLPDWLEDPDVWLVESEGATMDALLADPAWQLAYSDWLACVFVPADLDIERVTGPFEPPPDGRPILFP